MTLEEEGEMLRAAVDKATAEYITALEVYDKYLDNQS